MADDDYLDAGLCDAGGGPPRPPATADDDVDAMVLFGDLVDVDGNPVDPDAIAERAAEWRAIEQYEAEAGR